MINTIIVEKTKWGWGVGVGGGGRSRRLYGKVDEA